MSHPTCSPSRRGSSWAPAEWLCWVCALLVLLPPVRLPALTPSELEQIGSLLEESQQLRLTLQELRRQASEQRLKAGELELSLRQAEQRAQQLDARLQLWQEHSAELSDSLERLSSDLAASRSSLGALRSDLAALSRDYSGYRLAAEFRIRAVESSARAWRTLAIAGIIGALAGGFLAGVLVR